MKDVRFVRDKVWLVAEDVRTGGVGKEGCRMVGEDVGFVEDGVRLVALDVRLVGEHVGLDWWFFGWLGRISGLVGEVIVSWGGYS